MGSEDRVVKEKQLEKAVATFEARKTALAERGLDEKAVKKDPVLRSLGAKVKKARGRIASIETAAKHVAETAAKETKKKKDSKKGKGKGKVKAAPAGDKGAKGTKGSKKKGK